MYRTLIPVLLYTIAVAAAPQEYGGNSGITYVKIQPVTGETPPSQPSKRESRIENLSLKIPGLLNIRSNVQENEDSAPKNSNQFVNDGDPFLNDSNQPVNGSNQTINDVNQFRIRNEDTTASYETDTVDPTFATETTALPQQTEAYETKTKAPSPRFLSKLSYFKKDDGVRSSVATNQLERMGKRFFKSKCRCEKSYSCPRLQITVPRCPNEYFLCC